MAEPELLTEVLLFMTLTFFAFFMAQVSTMAILTRAHTFVTLLLLWHCYLGLRIPTVLQDPLSLIF